jgi:hypothetical protein
MAEISGGTDHTASVAQRREIRSRQTGARSSRPRARVRAESPARPAPRDGMSGALAYALSRRSVGGSGLWVATRHYITYIEAVPSRPVAADAASQQAAPRTTGHAMRRARSHKRAARAARTPRPAPARRGAERCGAAGLVGRFVCARARAGDVRNCVGFVNNKRTPCRAPRRSTRHWPADRSADKA